MKITWKDSTGKLIEGRVEAVAQPFVAAIGAPEAARFLIHFGGSQIYLGNGNFSVRSPITKFLGKELAEELAKGLKGIGTMRVPMCNEFLARHLRSTGKAVNDIARTLRVADNTVRRMLASDEVRREQTLATKEKIYGEVIP